MTKQLLFLIPYDTNKTFCYATSKGFITYANSVISFYVVTELYCNFEYSYDWEQNSTKLL